MRSNPNGRILFLNGASSSGKSSLAMALQETLDEAYLHVGIDTFLRMLPAGLFQSGQARSILRPAFLQVAAGFHRCIAALASAGNHLVVDHVLETEAMLRDCVRLLDGFEVTFVGVRCPLAELRRRELGRDRTRGTAESQLERVHAHALYDVEVDTSKSSPTQCAIRIKEALTHPGPRAFDRLRVIWQKGSNDMDDLQNSTLSAQSLVVASPGQVSSTLAEEKVILRVDSGMYYSLDPIGARIWELIQEPRSLRDLREAMLKRYDVGSEECETTLRRFLHEMLAEGLIEVRDGAAA